MRLYLARPSLMDENELWELIDEYERYTPEIDCIDRYEGIRELSSIEDYKEWTRKIDRNRFIENIPSHLVASTFYFVKNLTDNRIVGGVTIRHSLNDSLFKFGGHISYSIRPTERRKGYGTEMLKLALLECKNMGIKKVLLTCKRENIGSAKVILNNGGILENEIFIEERGYFFLRYWISI